MNILVIGSGGREHALSWKISQSPVCEKLYVAPGNPGTGMVGENVALNISNFDEVADFIRKAEVGLLLVGPEDPLVNGIHDYLIDEAGLEGLLVIGPRATGARLEGSKDFSKRFMQRHNIPTAAYQTFTAETLEEGKAFLAELKPPYVLKADGPAAGKGVLILRDLKEAQSELGSMLVDSKFGKAGSTVVIEEFLDGIEFSVFALTDGKDYILLPEAKDYKRIGEGDTGLNTGGMGAVSPVPFCDSSLMEKVEARIVKPTIEGLRKENIPYVGFVFFGLIRVGGEPMVIEYNCRMGDPETEVVIPRIQSDILPVLIAAGKGKLAGLHLHFDPRTVATIMLVSGGYPGSYPKGKVIRGTEKLKAQIPFHAGTTLAEGQIKTNGGRVMAVSAYGEDKDEALERAYQGVELLEFDGMYYRKDIGFDL